MLDLMSLGFSVPIATVMGGALGFWLDRRFDTRPWLFVVFLGVGIAAGLRNVIRSAAAAARDEEVPTEPTGERQAGAGK